VCVEQGTTELKLQTGSPVTSENIGVQCVICLPSITFDTCLRLTTNLLDVAVPGLSVACKKSGWSFIEEVAFLLGFFFFQFLHEICMTAVFSEV
jgi:hypothetical protein